MPWSDVCCLPKMACVRIVVADLPTLQTYGHACVVCGEPFDRRQWVFDIAYLGTDHTSPLRTCWEHRVPQETVVVVL
jgi:hypothetical protein